MLMRKNFHLLRRGLKDKNKDKDKDKDVDQHMEWQRNVIRSEYVDEKKSIQTEKEIQSKGRGSVE
ncbi:MULTISPECIES: hypothetical protein [Bacillus cereus group]|uniref:hypothetical protein n=1 Tax=Bacillus cereus group TaxID=86661 RepID=UPI000BF74A30|nr:hypothetical protein [Bacillus cereus]MDR4436798.1 hypothetical protein [Bacillus cereus]PES28532.1 hypothetical protein CN496_17215 [Bacillus cereus]PET80963.1 hypothetical protein CN528_13535 [Bacillus cereus]PFC81667.1 hypothetical protein CN298_10735 [Bacillus cereus]PFR37533.1 hypothetical protein COK20_15235 [Bacillus cereus]